MPSPPSRFLPDDFDGGPICLIAGQGRYPALAAERARAAGLDLSLIGFRGETDAALFRTFDRQNRATIQVGQLGHLLKAIKRLAPAYALMAGQITPKRLFHGLHPDLKALTLLNRLKERNAETIFGAIAEEIEALGVRMLDARSFLDDHMAGDGRMTPSRRFPEQTHLDHGARVARGAAELDIGQGCVVRRGTVLAVEAYEGTDAMIRRAGTFKTDDLIFVKTVKANQDYRFDVPVFGEHTLDAMDEAGVKTAALEADGVIMLDKPAVLERAREKRIAIVGFR